MCKKESCVVSAAIVMAIAAMMFFPATGTAGSPWSIKLPASERFVVLADFNNEAVLDKETGLVWEKSPAGSRYGWSDHCADLFLGGRKGWHLPTIEQLTSLADPSVLTGVTLPDGHPFTNVMSSQYWSATTVADAPGDAWGVSFYNGGVGKLDKTSNAFTWCVRGGVTYDGH
jgi:hypothetical protein